MKKLLIIEDETSIRENYSEIFEDEGYEVAGASCGIDGIKLAASFKPNLIICDIMMPGMDGFEVKIILSKHISTSSIPFIFLTGKSDIMDVQQAMKLGADDYITKPVSKTLLLELVSKRLQRIDVFKTINTKKTKEDLALSLDEKIILKSGGKHLLITVNEIVIIKASNNYSEVVLSSGQKAMIKGSLKSWENKLPVKNFLRVHRNTIINLELIEKIESNQNGSYLVKLKYYPEIIQFSHRYSQKARKLLLIK
jgi:DNA-binding LytR/AlgR family response regulator